ncbi:MAG: DPP IV N-terminal domain-containing protein [Rhodothermaceae bacterium]
MKKIQLILLLIIFTSITFSQNKLLTVEDIVYHSYGKFRPAGKTALNWIADSDSYSFMNKKRTELKAASVKSKKAKTILTIDQLNKAVEAFVEKPLKRIPYFSWRDENRIDFSIGKKFLSLNIEDKTAELLNDIEKDAANIDFAPNHKAAAYTIENNLLYSPEPGKVIKVTNESNKGILNGQAVHQREFGIRKGIFWSPKSSYIAYYRMDETMVTDYPILEVENRPMTVRNIKYPMAGDPSHHVTIGIYNVKTAKTVFLKTGEKDPEHFYTCITWGPEEEFIYVTHLNRDQNHSKLVKYNAATGEQVKVLFEEKDPQFVEPEEDLIFLPDNAEEFLVFSERSGYKHLYHYNTDGELIRQITDGNWVTTGFNGFSEDGDDIFITSTKETPVERHLYKVELESGKMKKLTSAKASHRVHLNAEAGYFIDTYTSMEIPLVTEIVNFKGKAVKEIAKAKNPLKDYKIGETKIITIKAEDGTDLYCRLTLPADFDKTKKYPAIVYVYGGPHSQDVRNVWPMGGYKLWDLMMAQKGYVIFYVDNRGTDNRGTDFEQATHRQLGTLEVADQLKGVEYLVNTGFVDKERIGCWGWSYGGFMTTSMITRSDAFKVGVAGGAVIDWNLYEIMYTERYMDTPQQNPEGFKKANLINHVENLKGKKLLLVHGTSDPVVIWQHTLRYAKKASTLNMPLDYYPYIGHGHGVRGKDRLQLYHKITNYFLDNL